MTDNFLKHVFTAAGGTVLSQSLLILAAPVLTRLYNPDEFGHLAVLISFISILLVIVSLRYEMAIPLAKDTEEATHLLSLSLSLVVLICGAVAMTLWFLTPKIEELVHFPDLSETLTWFMLGILGAGSYQALKYFGNRHQQFRLLSIIQVGQSFIQTGLQIVLGMAQVGSVGLIIGYVVAQWVGIVTLVKHLKPLLVPSHPTQWGSVARSYQQFPLYTLWSSLLTVLGWQLPPLLFASYFSVEIAGCYGLTMRVLGMPAALIGQAVAQVFYPWVANTVSPGEVRTLVERVTKLLWVFGMPVFALIFLQGGELFKLIFGPAWEMAGVYAQWLAPWFLLSFIGAPLSTFALVKTKQRQAFWFTVYEICIRVCALSTGAYFHSANLAIQLFSAAGVLISTVYISWILHLAGSSIWVMMKHLKEVIIVNIGMVISLLLIDNFLSPWWGLGVTVIGLMGMGWWGWWKSV